MDLPSKIDYPDYYLVISEPIDMSIIERKILEDKVRPHFLTAPLANMTT
jgi:hypothetical protein